MLKGVEYAHSSQKRKFDLYVARTTYPAYLLTFATAAVAETLALLGEQPGPVLFTQDRVGQNEGIFSIKKIRTLDANGGHAHKLSKFLRSRGLDELAQLNNVIGGEMSINGGYRPLVPIEHDEVFETGDPKLVDKFRRIVMPTRPSIISSFGLLAYRGAEPDIDESNTRLELGIKDIIDGSLTNDLRMLGGLAASAASQLKATEAT